MDKHILDRVSERMFRDASGDPSALTPAQRAEREGMNDPERFDEFTGPMEEPREYVVSDDRAGALCNGDIPPPGYMRAVRDEIGLGWIRHLKVSGCFIFSRVDSFRAGTGVGAIRRMCY